MKHENVIFNVSLTLIILLVYFVTADVLDKINSQNEKDILLLNIVEGGLTNEIDQLPIQTNSGTWGYEGEYGPEYWGNLNPTFKLCKIGRQQSPINLSKHNLVKIPKESYNFNYIWSNFNSSFEMVNNGHSVQVNIPISEDFTFIHDNIKYNLVQFHFHAPSEHHVANQDFPFEIHFVHAHQNEENGETQFHVIGVFAQFGEGDEFIEQFIQHIKKINEKGTKTTLDNLNLPNLNQFFNESAWSYDGSLTTPPCTEGVKWMVANKYLSINVEQLQEFKNVMPFNARPTRINENVPN